MQQILTDLNLHLLILDLNPIKNLEIKFIKNSLKRNSSLE